MTSRPVSVEIYTSSHRVLGRIVPGTAGLFGFLNVATRSTVEIEGAHLNRLHQPARLVARYPKLWLTKDEISVVLVSSRSELGPVSIVRSGYTTMVSHWVHIMMAGFELKGMLETPGKLDFNALLVESERLFLPVYSAWVQAILFPDIHAQATAMLFNLNRVHAAANLPRDEIPVE